ncbi:MAG: VWA domain-containing protein, partial [Roseiflexaceae bacterium]|nr:VWA domain-containing protein [Roseiflexaceae bacterium]
PAIWALALVAPRRVAAWRQWASLGLRTSILAALALALAGAQLRLPERALTTVFLLDRSDSVSQAQRAAAERFVAEALQAQQPGDQVAVVVFGQNALVERAPAALAALGRLNSAPLGARTNLQDAIQLGLALFPDNTQKRLVLLSDGGENGGRVFEALQLARARDIPIDVINTPSGRGSDVLVERVNVATTAREGQEILLGVVLQATVATSGRLLVFVDGELAFEETRVIPVGESTVALRLPAGEAGYRRIEARVEAEGDSAAQNNRSAALTEVLGPPRVLVIAAEPQRAANLRAAIAASGAVPEVVAPNQAPVDLTRLGTYAGVVLFDTPARALPRALVEALPTYVRDLGGGLAMVGGTRSFGAGGYRRTPIEPLLPVELDPRTTQEQPDVALTMVIDRSGSMLEPTGSGGRTKLDLAKEAVYQASLGLSERDQIGLVVFDEGAEWILPLQKLPDSAVIENALSQFGPGGGTNIRPGVELAARAMSTAQARVKHVILLTDGIADDNYRELIENLNAQGVTISTVAIGRDANPVLEQIAGLGQGRFYQVEQVDEIPNIFLQETVLIAGRDIIEREFTPEIALQSPIVRGLNGLPVLRGYNGTEQKPTARTILVSPDGKPILAQEQIGLGRTLAWTSDFDGRWSSDFVAWSEFPRFVSGLIDLLSPPRAPEGLRVEVATQGDQAVLDLLAADGQGQPLNNLAVEGRLVDPQQQGAPLVFTQVGPGRYRASAPATETGVYLAQLAVRDSLGTPLGSLSAGVAVSYSPEYGDLRENAALLRDIAAETGGRTDPTAAQVFERLAQSVGTVRELGLPLLLLALVLLPFDIAVRRLFVPLRGLLPRRAAVPQLARSPDPAMARL